MRYEILGESLKSAISIKLGEIFRTPVMNGNQQAVQNGQPVYNYPIRYKENITSPSYPNFSIIQVNNSIISMQTYTESALNNDLERIQLDYLFNIQYRVAENTDAITNLRQQLDAIGLKLNSEFKYVTLGLPVYTKNRRYEIVDGVLQFFFNITIFATMEQQDDGTQGDLSINESIKEE